MKKVSRRNFIKGAGVIAAGAALTGLAGCGADEGKPDVANATNSTASLEWVDEADVVIVGTGAAGLSAAATMSLENLGSALVLEAAPEELRGGNTIASGQIVFCPDSPEAAIEYQSALNGPYSVPDEVMKTWAEDICQNVQWLTDNFGGDYEGNYYDEIGEFPEMPKAEQMPSYLHEGKSNNQATWQLLFDYVDGTDTPIYYDSRAIKLITNESNEIIGVSTEDGRNFKANKGVILACGGFESNPDMMAQYMPAGFPERVGKGTWYNRGDGIKMAQEVGAQLWHMNNCSGNNLGVKALASDEIDARTSVSWQTNDYIYLNERAQRFINETVYELRSGLQRHGKNYRSGTYADLDLPTGAWAVFGQAAFDAGTLFSKNCFAGSMDYEGFFKTNQEALDAGVIVKCGTLEEVANATGYDVEAVTATVNFYNESAEQNKDTLFHRGEAMNRFGELISTPGHENDEIATKPFDLVKLEPPYYVIALHGQILNTQGGPKRTAECEIVDASDAVIPRLYGAGEMGCAYPYVYNVGGNVSEAISSGRRSARNAAALKPLKA